MKTGCSPCEHGYYGICTRCVREERDELRARVAELEVRIEEAEKQEPAAWRKGKYLRSNETMADTPEDHDGLTRYGWEPLYTRPIPAPVAAVPAAQAEPDDKHVAAVRTLERCGYQYYDALAIGHYDWYLCKSAAQAEAKVADDATCEALIESSDMRWNGDVYVGDGHDLMNLVRAAMLAAKAKGGGK